MKNLTFTREQVSKILEELLKHEVTTNELFKLSVESLMLSERSYHNESNGDVSNGFRRRRMLGKGKCLELRVPRSRYHHFYPVLLGILKDEEEECRRLAFSLYGNGLTTEQVSDIFEKVYGYAYSTSQISRMFSDAKEHVRKWLSRSLEDYYPIIYIDATFISTRRVDSVSKEAYYTVLGVCSDRRREVLGVYNLPSESPLGWEIVFDDLKHRGVKEIGLVVCDALSGIEEAILAYYPMAMIQFCVLHLKRNMEHMVNKKRRSALMAELAEIFRVGEPGYDKQQAMNGWRDFCARWGKYYPNIQRLANRERYEYYFTYLLFHPMIQSMIYTTNWIERLNRDFKRVTRMRGAMPNAEATIDLLGHVAMTRTAYERKIPKLDYETLRFRWTE